MKVIAPKDFLGISRSKFLPLGVMVKVLRQDYCPAMHRLGECTTVCTNCKSNITYIIDKAAGVPSPRNKAAILRWAVRSKIADIGDREVRTTENSSANVFELL